MPKRKRIVRRRPAALWIQRFPWCRGLDAIEYFHPPRDWGGLGEYGYPHPIRQSHLIVDEVRFAQFVSRHWGVMVDETHLNVLEYFGLVVPIRKILTASLQRTEQIDKVPGGENCHIPVETWFHTRRGATGSVSSAKREPYSPVHVELGDPTALHGQPIHELRPTPLLWCGFDSAFFRAPRELAPGEDRFNSTIRPRKIPPPESGQFYPVPDLTKRGLWFRPLDPAYWALLERGLNHKDPDLDARAPGWIKTGLRGLSANALRIRMPQAQHGNYGVTRLYVIGQGERDLGGRCASQGGFGVKLGQDWVVGTILRSMGARVGFDLALELDDACRPRGRYSNRKIVAGVLGRWRAMAGIKSAFIPHLIPNFHRNVLLWLIYTSRDPAKRDRDRDYRDLGRLVGLTPDSVHQACAAGRRALVVK